MAKVPTADPALSLIGKKAPSFKLQTYDGEMIDLKQFAGEKKVVLYFYPKDMTSGCTKQACAFQEDLAKFKKAGAIVLGVSPDSVASHEKFRDKYSLKFPLLADEGAKVATKYGVWGEKSMYGRKYMGINRSTFLIDKDGKILAVWSKVKVPGHSQVVLDALKELTD